MSAKDNRNTTPDSRQVNKSQEFHVGDYVDAFDGFAVGHIAEITCSWLWIDFFSYPDGDFASLFMRHDQFPRLTLIMPVAARAYFEQFVGDEGGE